METLTGPVDLIPNSWRSTPTESLIWWLGNPLVQHFFPDVAALRLSQLPTMPLAKQQQTLFALRGARAKARASRPRPSDEGYPLSLNDLECLYARIEDKNERDDMRRFGRMLHPMEYSWFAEQLGKSLDAREGKTTA